MRPVRMMWLFFGTLLSLPLAMPALAGPSGEEPIQRAQAYESALMRSPARVRMRHNLERLIALWGAAERQARGASRRTVLEGQQRAWKLLGRWSGLDSDRARAEALARRLESEKEPEPREVDAKQDPPKTNATSVRNLKRSAREAPRQSDDLLSVRRVVIDAGHGGKDHGAQGIGGVLEKNVNLGIAKKLGRELKRRLGIQVVYTRSTDQFLSLQRRALIANRTNADLFVSIHANAHGKRSVRGIETYYLDTTSDRYAVRLADRENNLVSSDDEQPEPGVGASERDDASLPGGTLGRDLRLILADLAMRSATSESKRLAGHVQSSMVGTLRRRQDEIVDLGVKHALFYVLLGARMPSILVETGFVTHPTEGRRLAAADYQEQVASSIAQGIARWVMDRNAIARKTELHEQKLASLGVRSAMP